MSDFTPSKYQKAIFSHTRKMFTEDAPNLGVIAGPGTGKTTSMVQDCNYIPRGLDSIYCAYNKSIQLELEKRLPQHVEARTFHSLGLSNIRAINSKIQINKYKMPDIFQELVPEPDKYAPYEEKQDYYQCKHQFTKAASMAKNLLVDFRDNQAVWDLMSDMDLEGYETQIAPILPEALQMAINNTDEVDFDDMIWLPIVMNLSLKKYDFMAVDEAQDTNLAQIELVLRSLRSDGKVCVIGDPRQSIYRFRGADHEAMDRLIFATQAVKLPLPITYRCPIKVVQLAQRFAPELEWREGAPEGIIDFIGSNKMSTLVQPKDMILCRINAPLVPLAFSFIRRGIKANIMGKEIGKSLGIVAKKASLHCQTMRDLYNSLYEMRNVELQKVINNDHIKGKTGKLERINNKYDTLVAVADNCNDPKFFQSTVENLFADTTDGVILSTAHKSKGLEAYRIFIIEPGLMPHPLAKSPEELTQEENLFFVATTRSKSELYFVDGRSPFYP